MIVDSSQVVPTVVAVTGAMMAFGKYCFPVIKKWFGFVDKYTALQQKVYKLENNHMAHFEDDIKRIEASQNENFKELFNRLGQVETLVGRVDERTKNL